MNMRFDSHTLDLFEPDPPVRRHHSEVRLGRAFSSDVKSDILRILAARHGEWLGISDFREVSTRHDISCCIGFPLYFMARAGSIKSRDIYLGDGIGAERPGSGNYRGFKSEWSAV